ncbi:MAG: phospholipase [Candidatus Dormiibacterota bacterium]
MPESRATADPSRAVMVDVGPGFGALVVMAPAELQGKEIEISSVEAPERRQHVYVLPRTLPRGTAFAAVFPRLRAGDQLLWSPLGVPTLTVAIREGLVEEVTWPRAGADFTPVATPSTPFTSIEGD